jgi:hypothetical protein
MRNPTLTVLTTVHNRERYLDQAIESILTQDFTDLEYVIVDDGSTDRTPEILRHWAERDSRVVLACLPERTGIPRALNHGLALARGQYVGKQDSDDICVGSRLRLQVELLDREPDVVLVSANYKRIDAAGRWMGTRGVENPPELFPFLLNFSNTLVGAGSQGMFRRDTARELGGFNEDFEVSVDYEFWSRLVRRGRIVILPFIGLKCRLHGEQSSIQLAELQQRNSRLTSRRMLTAYLERAIPDDEFNAVASIWRHEGRVGVAAIGNNVLREAYARFAVKAAPSLRRRARRFIGGQWCLSALRLAQLGHFAEAARYFGYALVWHPAGLDVGISRLAERLLVMVRRTLAATLIRLK